MQTVTVFGASGQTGQQILLALLAKGYAVRAVCRPTARLTVMHSNLLRLNGSLLDPLFVRQSIQGAQAVVIALGPNRGSNEIFLASVTQFIIQAMHHKGVARLVCVTGAMIGEFPRRRSWFVRWMAQRFRASQPAMMKDREEQENVIQDSKLLWTIVKPPRLTRGVRKGTYKVGLDLEVTGFSKISRPDVADFIAKQLNSNEYLQQMPVIQY